MRKNQNQLEFIAKKISQKLIERVAPDVEHSKRLLAQSENHLHSAVVSQNHDLEGAYALLYDAARKALSAILSIHGLRATSFGGHSILCEVLSEFYIDDAPRLLKPFDRMREVQQALSNEHLESLVVQRTAELTEAITQEKEASQNARNMASIIESSNDSIASANLDGIITSWNVAAERMYGYLAEEMIGQSTSCLVPPESAHENADIGNKIRDGYAIEAYETLRIRKDGSIFPISLTVSPIFDENGAVIGRSGISRDITQEKEMIRQLQEANELRNEFVAMVAHDILSPATSISGYANLLLDRWGSIDDEKKIDALQVIVRNTEHLAKFVEDVLQVARIETGEFTFNIREFDIHELVKRAILELTSLKGHPRIQLDAPDDLPLGLGDEDRQWQIIMNLLSNAVKFSPADEPITLRLSLSAGSVEVAVIDHGMGIAKEDQAKLFQKFGRVPQPGGNKVPGNGLGFYICKNLVEAQGGRLWCESTPGQGSTFAYTIPVSAPISA